MSRVKNLKFLILFLAVAPIATEAQVMKRSSCAVPLDERKSSPSIDLLDHNHHPIDRDQIIDLINQGKDTSVFEPQLSDLYIEKKLPTVEYNSEFPSDQEVLEHPLVFKSSTEADHLTQARVSDPVNTDRSFRLSVTYDLNAALARNALLRKIGYRIPSPRYYSKLSVQFPDLDTRNDFLIKIARMRDIGLWLAGGKEEAESKNTTITLINVALESALIGTAPPMHWGIFNPETLQSRRSIRALLVPLTLLDIDESVNMYSFEPAKVENNRLVFSRVYASSFKNETSLGDARWIAKKISKLTRDEWREIIHEGHYPVDIEALILEKTIGRTNQLMKLLQINEFSALPNQPYLSIGQVISGKAYQAHYEGYPHFFAYGDPLNPLRISEIARYFTVEAISNGIKFALDEFNKLLQIRGQDFYVKKHSEKFKQDILNHLQTNPNEPYVQPLESWGGPIAGGGISAGRSVLAGTYYGSSSPIQMIDTISVNARVGAFVGISGIKNIGLGVTPTLGYNRSYVHVRPINDIKSALKNNWLNLAVPFSMVKLSNILLQKENEDAATAIQKFLDEMKTGEMFIITDGFTLNNNTMVGIPIGALMGFAPPISNLSETINLNNQYAILSRTTLYKSETGLHVYLTDIHSNTHDISADTEFILKLFSMSAVKSGGKAHTSAYLLPSEFKSESEQSSFKNGIRSILRKNNPTIIETAFKPYQLEHDSSGGRTRFKVGPWQWTKREIMNRLEITPPVDADGRYDPLTKRRTVIQGQTNRIIGSDIYGFFGSILNRFFSFINLGGGARGDDPSSNFLGRSKAMIVSTEIETTSERSNNTVVKIQETHSGWSMRKRKLLRLIDQVSNQVEGFLPNGGLTDLDSFNQTKRVQAYNLIWNLSIYEPGINRLIELLNSENLDTKSTTRQLIALMGAKEYNDFCYSHGAKPGFSNQPFDFDQYDISLSETIKGTTTVVSCITPWMRTIYSLREKLAKHREIFEKNIHDEHTAKLKIRWLNHTFHQLQSNMDLSLLIKLVGVENSYFQLSLAGYRKGDERAQDEEGRSTYYSNTIGSINTSIRSGPLDDISSTSTILQHEISARYLTDGF